MTFNDGDVFVFNIGENTMNLELSSKFQIHLVPSVGYKRDDLFEFFNIINVQNFFNTYNSIIFYDGIIYFKTVTEFDTIIEHSNVVENMKKLILELYKITQINSDSLKNN